VAKPTAKKPVLNLEATGTVTVDWLVAAMESPAHRVECGPDCFCARLRELPVIQEALERARKAIG
jgi:hypothetical protein